MRLSGIYCIEIGSDGIYYGSSNNVKRRFKEHRTLLRGNRHSNVKMQNIWNKYGESYFSFYVVETVIDISKLVEREQWWIDFAFATLDHDARCNISPTAELNSCGPKTQEHKDKIGAAHKGKVITPEQRKRISDTKKKQNKKLSQEARDKLLWYAKNNKKSVDDLERQALSCSGGKVYTLIDSAGVVYSEIKDLTAFAREHQLDPSTLNRVASGKYKQHKGFCLVKIDILEEYKK